MADETLEELEEQLEELELESQSKGTTDYGSPKPKDKESMFKFFKFILSLPESWKVGNLKENEIGLSDLSIRSYLDLGLYAEAEGLDIVSLYFRNQARIVAEPTMGRKGFMPQLFVTNIRKEQKLKEPTQKKKWFGGNKDERQEG